MTKKKENDKTYNGDFFMNQQQLDDLTTILQDKANQRYDNTLLHRLHQGRGDDTLVEVLFEGYVSYIDGINEVIKTIAEKQELHYLPIERRYLQTLERKVAGENID